MHSETHHKDAIRLAFWKSWANLITLKQNSLFNIVRNILPLGFIFISFWQQSALLRQISLFAPQYTDRPTGPDGASIYFRFLELQSGAIPVEPDGNSPLFLYFLTFLQTIFHHPVEQVFIPYLIQIFFVLITGAFTYKIGTWLFSRNVGILSCLAVVFYGRILNYALAYANAIPILIFFTGAIYFFIAYQRTSLIRYLLMGSLFLGVSVFGRGTALTQAGVFILWYFLLRVPVRKILINVAIMGMVIVVILAIPIWHNYNTYGQFVFVNTNGAMNLFIGNNPESQGQFYVPIELIEPIRQGHSSYEMEVFNYISQQPGDWFILMVNKLVAFFVFPWWRVGYLSDSSIIWWVSWLVMMGIAIFYGYKLFTPYRSILYLTLLGYTASIITFFVEERFRLPILPAMFIFASAILIQIGRDINKRLRLSNPAKIKILFGGLLGVALIYALFPQYRVGQAIGEIHTPSIYGGLTLGQSFRSPCDNLYRIDVKLRTNNPKISQLTTMHLREGDYNGPELYKETLDTYNIRRANYTSFSFPKIANSAGKRYTFFFDTAEMQSKDNGLIALVEPEIPVDTVKSGSALFNGQKVPGDLTFFAYCRTFFDQ